MFLKKSFILGPICLWTNNKLKEKGISKLCTEREMLALLGLELAASLFGCKSIRDLWSQDMFKGHPDFCKVMSRQRYETLRGSLQFVPTVSTASSDFADSRKTRDQDPLWACRVVRSHFLRNCAEVAVPTGSIVLDENSMCFKGWLTASMYLPSKPAKYAVRFYALVGNKYQYLFSMFDNSAGNTTKIDPIMRYCVIFPTLRRPANKIFAEDKNVPLKSPSALWAAMYSVTIFIQDFH